MREETAELQGVPVPEFKRTQLTLVKKETSS
jgi:hypothetical protein